MKTITMMTLIALLAFLMPLAARSASAAESQGGERKILVAYFSHSGNTREVANMIRQSVGGDIFEVKAVDAYPANYNACTERAKAEQESNARPALSTRVQNMDSYDVVFVGFPNWWGTIPMPLFTFFEGYNFDGKTVIPFCTHGGSGLGRSAGDIARLSPKATLLSGLAIRGSSAKSAQNDVASWLRGIGMTK